jgi:hypothetical protein
VPRVELAQEAADLARAHKLAELAAVLVARPVLQSGARVEHRRLRVGVEQVERAVELDLAAVLTGNVLASKGCRFHLSD